MSHLINEERLNEAEEQLLQIAEDYHYPVIYDTIKDIFNELRKVEVDAIDVAD